uniref:Gamma-glutamyl kinase n=1 Tax=Paulinella micropora TaxID=1928728 RepID=A0A385HZF4_9EUKA|nr:gamma-glutamyl kinase [Paulinella micropora]AXY63031.1 gamma-glutamyl kinase [Paulinella micropora]
MVQRRVIKVGTSLLRGTSDRDTKEVIADLARNLATDHDRQNLLVLVTSGAVGLGCDRLALKNRPTEVVALQAAAAVGQGRLMGLYDTAFSKYNIRIAQILLSREDLASKYRYQNASRTLYQLLDWGVIPIVNENDTLNTDELRFGDNDTLSALVSMVIKADELILLTDVSQLYSSDPKKDSTAKPIQIVHNLTELEQLQSGAGGGSQWGTGGMTTKLAAARMAVASGIRVRLADGRDPAILEALLRGEDRGTVFEASGNLLSDQKVWLAYAFQMKGKLIVDTCTEKRLVENNTSLIINDILAAEGNFDGRDAVRIININGQEVGRGMSMLSQEEISNFINERKNGEQDKKSLPLETVVIDQDQLILSNDIPLC